MTPDEDERTATGRAWPTAADEGWARRVRADLLREDVPAVLADAVLQDARAVCADSGRPAAEVFGTPQEYVRQRPQESLDPDLRARYDRDGAPDAPDAPGLLLRLGGAALFVSIGTAAREGWTAEGGYAHAALLAAVLGTFLLGSEALRRRRAGRLRGSRSAWAWAVVTAVAGIGAARLLRDDPARLDVPVLVPLLTSVAVVAVGAGLRARRPVAPLPAVPEVAPEQWFTRLEQVLRGRHLVPSATARREAAEARAFWTASGASHPREEFGTPEAYAVVLTDGDDAPRRRRATGQAVVTTLVAVLALVNLALALLDGDAGWWWRALTALVLGAVAVASWVRLARARA
ncbi:hypothetical protein [Kineococcus sp. SYSU DK002]|uniref:hypothetical protein n=1 Tax=Kineococcus sp. SYSU DK002 TaxID=3383123 RepID=UPI003D7D6AFB